MRYLILFFAIIFMNACDTDLAPPPNGKKLLASDFRIFYDTPAWELAQAVYKNDEKAIKKIIGDKKVGINYLEPKYGKTVLMLAIYHEKYEISKLLLELGADPNIHDNFTGSSSIFVALDKCINSLSGDTKFVKLLLKHGAKVNDIQTESIAKKHALSPLSMASSGSLPVVKQLVEMGADVNFPYIDGNSPLFQAVAQGRYDIVLYLLENGADPNSVLVVRKPQKIDMKLIDLLNEDEEKGDIPFTYRNSAQKVRQFLSNSGIN
jgi:uncharacterized protein